MSRLGVSHTAASPGSTEGQASGVAFAKLGGSVITDKSEPFTVRNDVLSRLAAEIAAAVQDEALAGLVLGHGSGSFGHQAAQPYGTREGVATVREWRGFAQVAAAAARLNRIVTDALLAAGVHVLSLQPSASARCFDGALQYLDDEPIRAGLAHGLVPLLYGDVAFDTVRGGTIVSTEDVFLYLAEQLAPRRILLVTDVPGVLDARGRVMAQITPSDLPRLQRTLGRAEAVDVTGGMADKVRQMVRLVERHPATTVHLLSGMIPGLLREALVNPSFARGTRIVSGSAKGVAPTHCD